MNLPLSAVLSLLLLMGCGESATTPRKAAYLEYTPTAKVGFAQFLKSTVPAGRTPIVYFYADWCGPCKRLRAALPSDEVDAALQQATVIKVNIDSCQELAAAYGVAAVPTLVKVDAMGQPIATITGDKWEEDIPAEIAPVLDKLVNSTIYDHK